MLFSFHVGSGCRDFTVYRRAMSYAKKLFEHGQKIGLKMNTLDIGGGFPGEVIDDAFSFSEVILLLTTDKNFCAFYSFLEISSNPLTRNITLVSDAKKFETYLNGFL